jgi:hypothetical protein
MPPNKKPARVPQIKCAMCGSERNATEATCLNPTCPEKELAKLKAVTTSLRKAGLYPEKL